MGKSIKKPLPQSGYKSKEPLDLVHSDVCGPMSVHSFSGYSYCVTFIDDYSRKTWIYFLMAKSEVLEVSGVQDSCRQPKKESRFEY